MIKAPLAFFEVDEEAIATHAVELGEPGFGKAPEALDAVDVVLAAGELVNLMVNAMVTIACGHEAVVGEPAVGVDIALGEDDASDNRLQLLARAVVNNGDENLRAALMQAEHRDFSARSPTAFAAHTPGAKVAFVDLDLARERTHFFQGQGHDALSPKRIKPMDRAVVEPAEISHRQGRNIDSEEPEHLPKFALGNPRLENVFVCHCN